jgi:hypothetical protein
MQLKIKILICAIILLITSPVLSTDIERPNIVSEMTADVTQRGSLYVGDGVSEAILDLYVPQEDKFQLSEITSTDVPSYIELKDDYGNNFVRITWSNPSPSIEFYITSRISINRYEQSQSESSDFFSSPTELVESSDEKIISLSSDLTLDKKTEYEKIASIAKWVYQNIEYDISFAEVNLSATQVLSGRKGVCSEYSTLFQSLVQASGIKSRAVVGWVYSQGELSYYGNDNFQPHAWAEVYVDDLYTPVDPTWAEVGKVDATHIKFASLPDSIFREANLKISGHSISKPTMEIKTEIDVVDYKEGAIISIDSTPLTENIWDGFAVVESKLSAPGCVLTKVLDIGCSRSGGEFLSPLNKEELIYFCGETNHFSIFKIPNDLEEGVKYSCPVTVYSNLGGLSETTFTLSKTYQSTDVPELTLSESTAIPNQPITAYSDGAHIFSDGVSAENILEIKSPDESFTIYAYKNGALVSKDVSVVSTKPVSIGIYANETMTIGETYGISITLQNMLTSQQTVTLRMNDVTKTVSIQDNEIKNVYFAFIPNENSKSVQIFVSLGDFTTSVSQEIKLAVNQLSILQMIDSDTYLIIGVMSLSAAMLLAAFTMFNKNIKRQRK